MSIPDYVPQRTAPKKLKDYANNLAQRTSGPVVPSVSELRHRGYRELTPEQRQRAQERLAQMRRDLTARGILPSKKQSV